ncbi:MAG: 23S rRNA (pseudouridine(1915)-N(3))-methyltransferase RlmH [Acidobacteria bacterium]|nr:23S rRNA (pseudouridine(1915)-N(3))-methyltransferase RlmH [Acidobacteriota bacterium]
MTADNNSARGVHNPPVAFEIVVVWVGRRREPWEALCADYRRRIGKFVPVREKVVRPARGDDRTRLRLEGKAIRAALPPEAWTVSLDRKGRNLSSEALATEIGRLRTEWRRPVVWIVGSDLGLDRDVLKSSRLRLSLGPLTLAHELARLTVFEQIYRSFTILEGINYHRRPFH